MNNNKVIMIIILGLNRDLLDLAINYRAQLSSVLDISEEESSEGELAAMVSFAIAFPDGFMALVDTYDVKRYFAYRRISLGLSISMLFFLLLLYMFHMIFIFFINCFVFF